MLEEYINSIKKLASEGKIEVTDSAREAVEVNLYIEQQRGIAREEAIKSDITYLEQKLTLNKACMNKNMIDGRSTDDPYERIKLDEDMQKYIIADNGYKQHLAYLYSLLK